MSAERAGAGREQQSVRHVRFGTPPKNIGKVVENAGGVGVRLAVVSVTDQFLARVFPQDLVPFPIRGERRHEFVKRNESLSETELVDGVKTIAGVGAPPIWRRNDIVNGTAFAVIERFPDTPLFEKRDDGHGEIPFPRFSVAVHGAKSEGVRADLLRLFFQTFIKSGVKSLKVVKMRRLSLSQTKHLAL